MKNNKNKSYIPRLFISDDIQEELDSVFNPFIDKEYESSDLAWQEHVDRSKSFWLKKFLKRILLGWSSLSGARTQKNIEVDYSSQWSNASLEENITNPKSVPCKWENRKFLARAYGLKRIHQFLLAKFIESTKPKSILEVGSGNGLNLFVLSHIFPSIRLSGIELTKGGFDASIKIASEDTLPEYILNFSPLKGVASNAHKSIDFRQGTAKSLPHDDNSFDIVFTFLALEQMEEIRNDALSQLSRVCKKYLVMVEPFRDWNDSSTNRHRVVSLDYFSAWISDLSKFGLKPVGYYENIPNKLHYVTNFLVVEKI
jgi:SAM-dependent methyltransferase